MRPHRPGLRVSAFLSRALLALVALLAFTASACQETPLPGTMYGKYKVTGQSKLNSCGAKLNAPDPWVFHAELSHEGSTLYWSWMDGRSPLSGPLTATRATITTTESANVDTTDAGPGACTLSRADDLELTLATSSPPATFSGTMTYRFTAASGSTCTDQLSTAGGSYAALPCSISYTLSAELQ